MRKLFYILSVTTLLASCNAKKAAVATEQVTTKASSSELVEKHYGNKTDFKTANIRTQVKFKDKKQDLTANAEIRIEKDKQILILVRYLGITFVKALITPDRVSYYDSYNGQYFDGDYQILSNWLGVDLDYSKVQNIFLGKSIYDLNQTTFATALQDGFQKIKFKTNDGISNEMFFEGANYLLMKSILSQPKSNTKVTLNYTKYNETYGIFLPAEVKILAEQKENVTIDVKYNSVSFNDNVSFKYDIPSGYKQITIEN